MLETTATQRQMAHQAQTIRQRLRHPPNAKPDNGINLRHITGLTGYQAEQQKKDEKIAIEAAKLQSTWQFAILLMMLLSKPSTSHAIDEYDEFSTVNNSDKEKNRPLTISAIQKIVAARYVVSSRDLVSERRTKDVTWARHVAMYVCRMLTMRALADIGRQFGNRDHSSVHHAIERVEKALQSDAICARKINRIISDLSPSDGHFNTIDTEQFKFTWS